MLQATGSGSKLASEIARSRMRFEMSMSMSSPIKVHSSESAMSLSASWSATGLADGVGENGVAEKIERCRASVLAYSRSR